MTGPGAHLEVLDGRQITVDGGEELHHRNARRFFKAVLGAQATDTGWVVPVRRHRPQDLVVRINSYLESEGFLTTRGEVADRSIDLALERRRSIERTAAAAVAWRAGTATLSDDVIASQLSDLGWRAERTLYPHQLRNVGHALAAINQANFSVPGAGKTATALAVGLLHLASGTVDVIVVVGPLASFEPWVSEASAAVGDRIRPGRVRGDPPARRRRYADATKGDLLLMSYATAAADRPALIDLGERLNVMLIVDESHRIKRFAGGVWAPALTEIAETARVRMILSGTPMPNGPKDLYSQLNVLWPQGLLTGSRSDFGSRVQKNFAGVLPRIQPFTIRTAKSELGLKNYKVTRHPVSMVGTQAEIYDLISNRLRDRVAESATWDDKLESLRRARPVRLLQAATNPDLLNRDDDYFKLPAEGSATPTLMERLARFKDQERSCKTDAALRLVQQISRDREKVVCWSNFVRNLDAFSEAVREELGLPVFQIDGRVPAADDPVNDRPHASAPAEEFREERLKAFLNHSGAAVLVTNPATCSESISLHRACHHAIYLDRTYDAALFLQSIDRIHRLGLDDDVQVEIHILQAMSASGETIDHLVDASLLGKQATMEALLEGAEIYPLGRSVEASEGDREDLDALLRYLIGEDAADDA